MASERRTVVCDQHGRVPWNGEVICSLCERSYQTADDKAPNFAPRVCVCGKPLMPSADPKAFTARLICSECYRQRHFS